MAVDHSSLALSQQIGLSICFGPQFLILTAAVLLTKLIQHDSPESGKFPWWFMPALVFLILAGLVVGVFLVVVSWTGLGEHTPDYWADIELSFMLLWSMLLESVVFTRLSADAFGGTLIKRLLQLLSVMGIVLLIVDIVYFAADLRTATFIPHTTMLAVAFFRGSMALSYCIMRILAVIQKRGLGGKIWIPLNVRIPFEVTGFALSFLSLSDGLSRIDYKLVQNGLFVIIGILHAATRVRRHRKIKVENGKKNLLEPSSVILIPGDGRRAMSLSNTSRTDTTLDGSEVELVTRKDNV